VNSELVTPETSTPIGTSADTGASSRRPVRRVLAVLAVAVVGLSACNSDPGRKRVAEDIIETAFEQGDLTEDERDCMFDRVEAYTEDELEEIAKSAQEAGPGTKLELFEADLAACK